MEFSSVNSLTIPNCPPTDDGVNFLARKLLQLSMLALLAVLPAFAAPVEESFSGKTVASVEVRGQKRLEKEAVLNKLGTRVGSTLSRETVRSDVQALYAMGYFDDISVQAEAGPEGVRLVFVVKERPVVATVTFEGNRQLATSDLKEVVKVKEWSILDVNKVRQDVGLLQKHYEDKGFFLAKVSYEIRSTQDEQVEVVYKVSDFDKIEIKKITFLNNRAFSDSQLKAVLGETREGGLLSFLGSSGSFKESAFKADLQRLTYFYLENGYVKFRYENPIITVSEDKRFLYLTVYVDEGDPYSVGAIDFSGDLLFSKDELALDVKNTTGEAFAISKRNADIQRLTERYQDRGYAFVNVIPRMNIREDVKLVDIDYAFEKGSLVRFGEINVLGNTKTYDKVIRREVRFKEGDLYSGTLLRQSREAVERLGFFAPGEVIFNTISPKGKADIVDVEVTVKERSTGTITLGAGYGSVQKFFFTTQISEINLFGRGQNLSLTSQWAANQQSKSFNLGFTDPYAFDTRWSMGFDIFYVNFPIPQKYTTRKLGFDVRLGYPLGQFTNGFITYKNEGLKIEPDLNANLDPLEVEADQGVLSSVITSVVRDKRNNRFETTGGNYQSVSLETAGLGGDKYFYKFTANSRYYARLLGNLVFRNSIEFGQIYQPGGGVIPPSEKFFLGGPNNLKGFQLFSVGPKRTRTTLDGFSFQEPLGGAVQAFGLFELEHPLVSDAGLKFVTFFDAGNAYGNWPGFQNFELRTDAGLGLRWFSPIGPLRFEWGFPLDRKPGEDSVVFNFFIGPPF